MIRYVHGLILGLKSKKKQLLDEISEDITKQIHPENTKKELLSFIVVGGIIILIGVTFTGCSKKGKKAAEDAAYQATIEALKDSFITNGAEKYEIVVEEDEKTCEICRDRAGKIYDINDFSIGDTAPPFHPNCRCLIEIYIPEEEESGIVYANAGTDKDRLSHEQQLSNAEYIYNYLIQQGWSTEAVCGLFGNIQRESHFNPGTWQDFHNLSLGYGLIQRDDSTKFLDWAGLNDETTDNMAKTSPKKLIDLQLEFLIWSCQPTIPAEKCEWFSTTNYDSPYEMTYAEYILSTNDPGDLALVFHASYERSNDTVMIRNERVQNAENWYAYFTTGQIPDNLFDG